MFSFLKKIFKRKPVEYDAINYYAGFYEYRAFLVVIYQKNLKNLINKKIEYYYHPNAKPQRVSNWDLVVYGSIKNFPDNDYDLPLAIIWRRKNGVKIKDFDRILKRGYFYRIGEPLKNKSIPEIFQAVEKRSLERESKREERKKKKFERSEDLC